MKIATYNCNSVRKRMPIILDWLAKHEPDVLALQETKVQDSEFPLEPLQDAGYHVHFRGMKGYNGVALLSREPPTEVKYGFIPGPDSEDFRIIQIKVQGIRIVNTYVPQGFDIESEKYQYKLTWLARLNRYLTQMIKKGDPLIWLGDLNVAPHPIDVARPEKNTNDPCFHILARKAYLKIVGDRLVDVYRERYPDKVQYTFWDFFRNAYSYNRGWRIDHILATPELASKCIAAEVDLAPREKEQPSDHTVMWAEFSVDDAVNDAKGKKSPSVKKAKNQTLTKKTIKKKPARKTTSLK